MGLWGPYGEYHRAYATLVKQNETAEILRATAMGKKYKPSKFPSYSELFSEVENAETLGLGPTARIKKKQTSMAARAVIALGGDVPSWIAEALD